MNESDFEELLSEMLNVSDLQREEDKYIVYKKIFDEFGIDFAEAYDFAKALILHTPIIEAGLTGKKYHAFVSRKGPIALIKTEAETQEKNQ